MFVDTSTQKLLFDSLCFDESTVTILVMDTSATVAGASKTYKFRWDMRVVLFASALAISGLISSIVRGNEGLISERIVSTGLQKTMLIFALGMGAVTGAKWWYAKKHGKL